MRKSINFLIWIVMISLVVGNIFLFYSSIKLGDEISFFEQKIQKIHHENLNLEKELSYVSSLQYAQKLVKNLKFTKKSQPSYLEKLVYAFNPNQ
ncbi:MAG: hypothetical protein V1803_02545 [Candidatus Roizmanbacteria bacterium]